MWLLEGEREGGKEKEKRKKRMVAWCTQNGPSHEQPNSAVSAPLRWRLSKTRYKKRQSVIMRKECNESARERRIALYKSDQHMSITSKPDLSLPETTPW